MRNSSLFQKTVTFTNEKTGREIRICTECKEEKDLLENFYKKGFRFGKQDYAYYCKICAARKQKERVEANPELFKERNKIRRKKMLADPKCHAEHLENQRIYYVLSQERKGKQVTRKFAGVQKVEEKKQKLPAAPLGVFLTKVIEQRRAEHAIGDPEVGEKFMQGFSIVEVCQELGTTDREYRRWCSGETKTVSDVLAERVLMALDADFEDVWP